jgi:quercetin dioxygenase-like cupin family protein
MASSTTIRSFRTEGVIESPDGGMRDTVLVADEVGAKNLCAGLVWIAPGSTIHEDAHPFDEVYYVVRGSAEVILDGVAHTMTSGDVVNIPATVRHRVHNSSDEVFEIFWCIGGALSDMPGVAEEMAKWADVDPATGWHVAS